jgi:hypothetical protein
MRHSLAPRGQSNARPLRCKQKTPLRLSRLFHSVGVQMPSSTLPTRRAEFRCRSDAGKLRAIHLRVLIGSDPLDGPAVRGPQILHAWLPGSASRAGDLKEGGVLDDLLRCVLTTCACKCGWEMKPAARDRPIRASGAKTMR